MLFADVAGFSGIDERKLPTFLAAYGDYLRELFASPVGRKAIYANTWGDGLYIVFDHAGDAANFAVELIDPIVGRPPVWNHYGLGSTTPFRVGLHAGPVFEIPVIYSRDVPSLAGNTSIAPRGSSRSLSAAAPTPASRWPPLIALESPGSVLLVEAVGVHSLAKNYDRCPLYRVSR